MFIANLAHYVYPSIFVLFADYQYQWGPREVGWFADHGWMFLVGIPISVIWGLAAPFLIAAFLLGVAILIAWRYARQNPQGAAT